MSLFLGHPVDNLLCAIKVSVITVCSLGDLGTRKRPGTSCKIEINFWFKITQYLINGIRFLSQICPIYSFPCARHRHKVSNSFTKESGRDKWLKVRNWISILLLVPVLLLTVRSPGYEYCSNFYVLKDVYKHRVSSLKYFLQILQNLEFKNQGLRKTSYKIGQYHHAYICII